MGEVHWHSKDNTFRSSSTWSCNGQVGEREN